MRLDPGFGAAQTKSQEASAITAGASVTPVTVEAGLKGTTEGAIVTAAQQGSPTAISVSPTGLGSTVQNTVGDINPSATGVATSSGTAGGGATQPAAKNAVSAGTGSDKPASTAKVTIVITRPKTP